MFIPNNYFCLTNIHWDIKVFLRLQSFFTINTKVKIGKIFKIILKLENDIICVIRRKISTNAIYETKFTYTYKLDM